MTLPPRKINRGFNSRGFRRKKRKLPYSEVAIFRNQAFKSQATDEAKNILLEKKAEAYKELIDEIKKSIYEIDSQVL